MRQRPSRNGAPWISQQQQQEQFYGYPGGVNPPPYHPQRQDRMTPIHSPLLSPDQVQQRVKELTGFVETMRHARSEANARPNVLTLLDALQGICSQYNVYAFEELGLGCSPLEIPVLRTIHFQNQRIWSFVTCFVASRRINTLYECYCGFLEHVGVENFAELGIGNSFVHSEAVQMYYQSPTSLPQVTTKEILDQLKSFQSKLANDPTRNSHHVDRNEFLVFLSQSYGVRNAAELGVYIDATGFGLYIGFLRRLGNQETKQLKLLEQDFQKCLAERVFELTKEKFSASNRQKALDELLASVASSSSSNDSQSQRPRQRTNQDLGSLSVDILNRVTQVDVFLDSMLQQKAALLLPNASNGIAEMDNKIRNRLTPLLVASQKSKHHSRIKVVTWVLCGILAKIQTLLVADPQDKVPEPDSQQSEGQQQQSSGTKQKNANDDEENDDEEEECDCCCVGKDVCNCKCKCECHALSDNEMEESDEKKSGKKIETCESTTQSETDSTSQSEKKKLEDVDQKTLHDQAQSVVEKFVASEGKQIQQCDTQLDVLAALDDELQKQIDGWRPSSLLAVLKRVDSSVQRRLLRSFASRVVTKHQLTSFLSQCVCFGTTNSKSPDTNQLVLKMGEQFGIRDQDELEMLGYGSLDQLVTSCRESKSGVTDATVIYSSAIRWEQDRVVEDVKYSEEEARRMLCDVPYLLNVEEAVQWKQRFQPFLGELEEFIEKKRLKDVCKEGFLVLNCHGILYRINENSTPSDLAFEPNWHDDGFSGRHVAIHLVSILVKSGNLSQFPRLLVLMYLKKTIGHALLKESSTSSIWRLIVDVLFAIPSEIGCFLSPLLVEAVADSGCAANEAECVHKLWSECRSTAEQIKLAYLGKWCNQDFWTTKLRHFMQHGTFGRETRNQIKLNINSESAENSEGATADLDGNDEVVSAVDNAQSERMVVDGCSLEPPLTTESCRDFVEKLRREQFGIGLELDVSTSQVLERQRKRLERAMKRLSDELYSENTHFVYELLQNADDNEYAANMIPKGEFAFSKDRIVFHSNERGFSAQNIQAICDVGASTKETAGDMIGHKGIGFKSVFKVSNSPEVHSNGYHIRFFVDRDGSSLGYILPHWIEDPQEWIQTRGSSFVLPLNQASPQEISGSLDDLKPSVLLFLKQIQEIHIKDGVGNKQIILRKKLARKEKTGIVSIEKNGVVQKWFVAKQRIPVDAEWAVQCGRRTVNRFTEISVAFPLTNDVETESEDLRGNPQKVFAFLPLRSYGFRFIVQADFDVPSSREAIFEGSQWNQWLISQFPALFTKAFVEFQQAQLPLQVFFGLFPLEREIQFPFRSFPVESTIHFRELCCLETESGAADGSYCGPLARPREVLDAVDVEDLVGDLMRLGQEVFVAAFGKRFLSVKLSKSMTPMLKSQLRIEKLETSHLLRLGTKFQVLRAAFPSKLNCEWVVCWLSVLSRVCLLEKHVNKALLFEEIAGMQVFPLQQHTSDSASGTESNSNSAKYWMSFRSITSSAASAPTSSASAVHQALFLPGDMSHLHPLVMQQLAVLDEEFVVEMEKQPQVKTFLKQLGLVKSMKEHDLLFHHVMPLLTCAGNNDVDASRHGHRELYLSFVAGHWHKCKCLERPEHATVVNALVRAWVMTSQSVVVVYDSHRELLAQTLKWLKLVKTRKHSAADDNDNEHYEGEEAKARAMACTFELVHVSCATRQEETIVREFVTRMLKLQSLGDVTIQEDSDHHSHIGDIWQFMVSSLAQQPEDDTKRTVSHEISHFLDVTWPNETNGSSSALESTLRDCQWIEASDGRFYAPSQLCRKSKRVHKDGDILSKGQWQLLVPFAKYDFENIALITALGLRDHPTTDQVLRLLLRWSQAPKTKPAVELSQLTKLYEFLSAKAFAKERDRDHIVAEFQSHPLVFVPSTSQFVCAAMAPQLCWWSSKGLTALGTKKLLQKCLDTSYPKHLHKFFVELAGVSRMGNVPLVCQRLTKRLDQRKLKWQSEWVVPLFKCWAKRLKRQELEDNDVAHIKRLVWSQIDALVTSSCCGDEQKEEAVGNSVVFAATSEERALQCLVQSFGAMSAPVKWLDVNVFGSKLKWATALFTELGFVPLYDHVVNGTSAMAWCDFLNKMCATSDSHPDMASYSSCFMRKGELVLRVLRYWASAFDANENQNQASEQQEQAQTQEQRSRLVWALRNATFYPSIRRLHQETETRFGGSNDVFVMSPHHVQTHFLSQQELVQSGAWLLDFGDGSSTIADVSPESDSMVKWQSDESLIRFLVSQCGLQRVDQVLSAQVVPRDAVGFREGSVALCAQLRASLALVQRFLVSQHAKYYKKHFGKRHSVAHQTLVKLAATLSCRVSESLELVPVAFAIGKSHSWQQQCVAFLDVDACVLFLGCHVGIEENVASHGVSATRPSQFSYFYEIVMEVSYKCFGSEVASSVANFLYLASLQPPDHLERWLHQTQQVAPLDPTKTPLWVTEASTQVHKSTTSNQKQKRLFASLQASDGDDDLNLKRLCVQSGTEGSFSTSSPQTLVPFGGAAATNSFGSFGAGYPCTPVLMRPLAPFANTALANSLSQEEKTAIGRWGEEFVFHQLQNEFQVSATQEQDVEIEWVNETVESGEPYDIKLTRKSGQSRNIQFIEVKSTKTNDKSLFEISMNELEYAGIHGSNYSIFRVFNAGDSELCRVERFHNPIALVRMRKIQLAVVSSFHST